jgi:hypothetical protein
VSRAAGRVLESTVRRTRSGSTGYGAPVRVNSRRLVAVLSVFGFVLLSGCGAKVDTTKVVYTRTTMPAAEANAGNRGSEPTGEPKANDEAFTNDKLRVIDPCGLLTTDILSAVGTPAENSPSDLGSCGNYMKDKGGRELNVTVYVGESIINASSADFDIGGLPAIEQSSDSEACFVTAVTSTTPNIGIKVQIGGDGEDLCGAGKTILTSIVELIREDPPTHDLANGTLVDIDPCATVDPAELAAVTGAALDGEPYNVHWCSFTGDDVDVTAWFRTGYDPKESATDATQPVDLGGGVTGYQELVTDTADSTSCRVEWAHRPLPEGDGQAEVVTVYFDSSAPKAGVDPCAPAQAVAKLYIAALPKP